MREIRRHMRVVLIALQAKQHKELDVCHPIVLRFSRYTAGLLSRYCKVVDGFIGDSRRTGRPWRKHALQVDGRVYVEARSCTQSGRTSSMLKGHFLGNHDQSGPVMTLTVMNLIWIRRAPHE